MIAAIYNNVNMETKYVKRSVNKEILQQILDSFVSLTGIRVAYYDDYIELVNGKNEEICDSCQMIKDISSISGFNTNFGK